LPGAAWAWRRSRCALADFAPARRRGRVVGLGAALGLVGVLAGGFSIGARAADNANP